jgi:hypothetical protein
MVGIFEKITKGIGYLNRAAKKGKQYLDIGLKVANGNPLFQVLNATGIPFSAIGNGISTALGAVDAISGVAESGPTATANRRKPKTRRTLPPLDNNYDEAVKTLMEKPIVPPPQPPQEEVDPFEDIDNAPAAPPPLTGYFGPRVEEID